MYKVIIVDDEAVVRIGLKNTINWNEHGFELIGAYANGREAWDAVELDRPDLVISDISMPFMDGLELAGLISAQFPYIKIIILTGFDEFEYAQAAIRLKVSDFILKPITAQEIRMLLDRVRAEMDEEKQRREDLSRLNNQLKQSLPLLKERFLERLVAVGLGKEEISEGFTYFNLPPVSPFYLVMVVDIDDFGDRELISYEHDAEFLRFAAFDIFQETLNRDNVLNFRTREERMVAIIFGQANEILLYEQVFSLAEEVRYHVEKYLNFTVTVGIGRTCAHIEQLPNSYKSALSALDYRFLLGKNRVLSIMDIEGKPSIQLPLVLDWDRKLATAVKTGDLQEAYELIEMGVAELKTSLVPVEACLLQMQKVVLTLMNSIQELVIHDAELSFDRQIKLMDVYKFKTLDEVEIWLRDVVGSIISTIADNRNHLTNMQIHRGVEYIDQNYANEKMSLQDLCRHVLMSTSYFSLVFKQHTGETFIEYLTRVRISKAKELLHNSKLKLYEIAEQVGYKDPNYLSILFKKHTGITPKDYRDNQIKGSGA
ncbi:response regulator transcription factor [Paenibacillus macquariensis]|uniref:Two-component system, response regulator YesN n=1 Tax=Paenibacillus macquariensis TaxID=948756 RepID=A0ABY1K5N7_9BACL|nr:response regulator [Paenibacillus macquariensis]MEC0090501.1 response regulator [Paenibacillus macquariensis]OAB38502.1 AraC family transcriptional regulator [Paenibacillus macquariensis subsp. macquariensis]SIR30238.1 two-component system, response regulator YesN [Paenibacillus macquariensis]